MDGVCIGNERKYLDGMNGIVAMTSGRFQVFRRVMHQCVDGLIVDALRSLLTN
jgi:hypothetical protein